MKNTDKNFDNAFVFGMGLIAACTVILLGVMIWDSIIEPLIEML